MALTSIVGVVFEWSRCCFITIWLPLPVAQENKAHLEHSASLDLEECAAVSLVFFFFKYKFSFVFLLNVYSSSLFDLIHTCGDNLMDVTFVNRHLEEVFSCVANGTLKCVSGCLSGFHPTVMLCNLKNRKKSSIY